VSKLTVGYASVILASCLDKYYIYARACICYPTHNDTSRSQVSSKLPTSRWNGKPA